MNSKPEGIAMAFTKRIYSRLHLFKRRKYDTFTNTHYMYYINYVYINILT